MSFSFFDHTADLGVEVNAATPSELFADAAKGLTAAICGNPESITATESIAVTIYSDTLEDLLYDWLDEILFRFDAEHFLLAGCESLHLTGDFTTDRSRSTTNSTAYSNSTAAYSLTTVLRGERFDTGKHQMDREVKAITYHQLAIHCQANQWSAKFVVDL